MMNRLSFTMFAIVTIIHVTPGYADYKPYEANLDKAEWSLNASPLECQLKQKIPYYGEGHFISKAGIEANMEFSLHTKAYKPNKKGDARLLAVAPGWKPGVLSKTLAKISVHPGSKPVVLGRDLSWQMLVELEGGMFPTIYYDSWLRSEDLVSVALSSVNFTDIYDDFIHCVDKLLPFTFDDIARSVLYFDFNRFSFNTDTKKRLKMIQDFLKVDNDIRVVLIAGHTDNVGGPRYNYYLGERRANAVKEYLKQSGILPKNIRIKSLGEKVPFAKNSTDEGRGKNRRVVLQLFR